MAADNPCVVARPEPFDQAYRSNELWARAQGEFEMADYYRRAADSIQSGYRHRAGRVFAGLRFASMAGWRIDLPKQCDGVPSKLVTCVG